MTTRPPPDADLALRVGRIARQLPGVHEEDAWTGVRWRVGRVTVAHVLALHHADAAERLGVDDGSAVTVVRLRCEGAERAALEAAGPPYLLRDDGRTLSIVLDVDTDWTEIAELVTESWLLLAPARLTRGAEVSPPVT